MNHCNMLLLLSLSVLSIPIYAQNSTLRPRAQIAQLKIEVEELLALLNVETIVQAKRAIKGLHGQIHKAHNQLQKLQAENVQLQARLETQRSEYSLVQQHNQELSKSLKTLIVLKEKSLSQFDALRTFIDAVPGQLP